MIWGLVYQRQVSGAGTINCIPQIGCNYLPPTPPHPHPPHPTPPHPHPPPPGGIYIYIAFSGVGWAWAGVNYFEYLNCLMLKKLIWRWGLIFFSLSRGFDISDVPSTMTLDIGRNTFMCCDRKRLAALRKVIDRLMIANCNVWYISNEFMIYWESYNSFIINISAANIRVS